MKKPTAFDVLEHGVTSTAGGSGRVSTAEQTRVRRARKSRTYFQGVREAETLEKLRRCEDIIFDWEDWNPEGFAWWEKIAAAFEPPPDMTIDEWADRYRVIPPEFAAEPGLWSTRRAPYMRAVMRACSPGHDCRRVVLVKPTQSGGTEAAVLNAIGYSIHLAPRSILVVFPTLDLAESFSRERLEPMISMMPALKNLVADVAVGPDTANRSSIKKKRYPGGFLNLVGANSMAGLSSRPVPVVIMDEVDAALRATRGASNPTKLASARTTAFFDRKEIFLSSPSNDADETGILQMWEDSSRGRLETRCPNLECGHWQVLEWERMDLGTVKLSCVQCGEAFNQWEWNGRGEECERWAFENPNHSTTAGFRLSGLNSPWLDWKTDLVDEYHEAKRVQDMGDDSLMRVFYNTKLAKPWRVLGKGVQFDLFNDRRELYECHSHETDLPEGVLLLTAAIDVQDSALVYEIAGWGKGRECWGIETGEFQGDPRNPASGVWDKIDQFVLNRVLRYADGKLAKVRLIVVDSGGHCTTEVYRYCSSRRPRVFALKGYGGQGKPIIIGGRTTEKSQSAWLLRIGVDTLKDDFHSRLAMDKPGPGFLHWPRGGDGEEARGYTEAFFAQLLSEQRVLRFSRKGFTRFEWWKQRRAQNEALDLACYNRAALEYLKVRLEAIPRDILALNPEALEAVETGLGQSILVQRQPSRSEAQRRSPAIITRRMEAALRGRGFSKERINGMTPAEAWEILQSTTPEAATCTTSAVSPPTQANPTAATGTPGTPEFEAEAHRLADQLERLHQDGAIPNMSAEDPEACFYANLLRSFDATYIGKIAPRVGGIGRI